MREREERRGRRNTSGGSIPPLKDIDELVDVLVNRALKGLHPLRVPHRGEVCDMTCEVDFTCSQKCSFPITDINNNMK